MPPEGKKTAMWIVSGASGGWNRIGRKEDDIKGRLVMWGSRIFFHITIVPPEAFDFRKGNSRSKLSSEDKDDSYSPRKGFMTRWRLQA